MIPPRNYPPRRPRIRENVNEAIRAREVRAVFPDGSVEIMPTLAAVRKAQELDPDLVILDFEMPVMNGCEAARALKKITPGLPMLMFTSDDEPDVKREARSSGILAVCRKADGTEPLLANVNALLA